MNIVVLLLAVIICFVLLVVLFFTLSPVFERKKIDSDKYLLCTIYMTFLLLPTSAIIILLELCKFDALSGSLIWLFTYGICNFLFALVFGKETVKVTNKKEMALLAMVLNVIYFGFQSLFNGFSQYNGLFISATALMIGYYIPLDVVLNDNYDIKKMFDKIAKLRLKGLKNKQAIFAIIICLIFAGIVNLYECIARHNKYEIYIHSGIIIGVILATVVISKERKKRMPVGKGALGSSATRDYKCYSETKMMNEGELFKRFRRVIKGKKNHMFTDWETDVREWISKMDETIQDNTYHRYRLLCERTSKGNSKQTMYSFVVNLFGALLPVVMLTVNIFVGRIDILASITTQIGMKMNTPDEAFRLAIDIESKLSNDILRVCFLLAAIMVIYYVAIWVAEKISEQCRMEGEVFNKEMLRILEEIRSKRNKKEEEIS